ncbi:hypothetical protein ABKN59_003903 [Abortiporus biennis]
MKVAELNFCLSSCGTISPHQRSIFTATIIKKVVIYHVLSFCRYLLLHPNNKHPETIVSAYNRRVVIVPRLQLCSNPTSGFLFPPYHYQTRTAVNSKSSHTSKQL